MKQTRNYKEINAKKKAMALSFRRFITLKGGGDQVAEYLGADAGTVREWIQSNWLPTMNWKNYGSVWVIDHIVPLRMFDLFAQEDLKLAWHYKNLMPLLKEDNLKKEGNVFFAFELLHDLKDKDFFFNKLYERILPEVKWMVKYINSFQRIYSGGEKATLRHIRNERKKSA
jgi:hypothetical protein